MPHYFWNFFFEYSANTPPEYSKLHRFSVSDCLWLDIFSSDRHLSGGVLRHFVGDALHCDAAVLQQNFLGRRQSDADHLGFAGISSFSPVLFSDFGRQKKETKQTKNHDYFFFLEELQTRLDAVSSLIVFGMRAFRRFVFVRAQVSHCWLRLPWHLGGNWKRPPAWNQGLRCFLFLFQQKLHELQNGRLKDFSATKIFKDYTSAYICSCFKQRRKLSLAFSADAGFVWTAGNLFSLVFPLCWQLFW